MTRFTDEDVLSFEDFASALAEVAHAPEAEIGKRTPLVDGLGLDSLSLAELIVMLMVDLRMESLSDALEGRDWTRITAGQLYDEYRNGRRGPVAGERVVFEPGP